MQGRKLRFAYVLFSFFLSIPALSQSQERHEGTGPKVHLRWREEGVDFREVSFRSEVFRNKICHHMILLARPLGASQSRTVLVTVAGGDELSEAALVSKRPLTDHHLIKRLATQALRIRGPVATLGQIPCQPLFGGKKEDEAISYTFEQFFVTGDATWPLLVPMSQAVSKALTVIHQVMKAEWQTSPSGYVLTGASKRGWTTWLTAAHDSRIKAIVPEVFDILNIRVQLDHQIATWGRYSEEIGDYSANGLPEMLGTPRGGELLGIVDPYQLRSRIKVPKLIVLGTNDAYWPVDAASLYFEKLEGSKYLLYMPNATHEILDRTLIDANLKIFMRVAQGDVQLPKVDFSDTVPRVGGMLTLRLIASQSPLQCGLWQARSQSRDFRQAMWSEVRKLDAKACREVSIEADKTLFTAAFVRAAFDVGGDVFTTTSLVKILPAH